MSALFFLGAFLFCCQQSFAHKMNVRFPNTTTTSPLPFSVPATMRLLKIPLLPLVLSSVTASTGKDRMLKGKNCRVLELLNQCEHETKKINGRDPGEGHCMPLQQGDFITHRSKLVDPDSGKNVGYLHSTCNLMYGGLNVGFGAAELKRLKTTLMFQGLFPSSEPHGNFEFSIMGSTGKIKNAQGWIEMNMDDALGVGKGHPAIFHIC